METSDTGRKIYRIAPISAIQHTGTIQGIWTNPDENVEWNWTHTPAGSYVSGYNISKKQFLKEVKDG